jgi:hypothetical protein
MEEELNLPDCVVVSGECVERLEVWCKVHCAEALGVPDFLPGLIVIVAEESERAVAARCWRLLRKLGACKQ